MVRTLAGWAALLTPKPEQHGDARFIVARTRLGDKLAVWAASLAVPTALAGFPGMNFHHMPELSHACETAIFVHGRCLHQSLLAVPQERLALRYAFVIRPRPGTPA